MEILTSPGMPKAAGHYSTCIIHNGTAYVSGQLPKDDSGNIPDGIEAQTRLVLSKLKTILDAAGSAVEQVIQVRIYIADVELWGDVNRIYAEFFGSHRPVRCVVPVPALHYGCLIELECTAVVT